MNVFSIHVGPLWQANINAHLILNPYVDVVYCIYYLTKMDKFVIREMQHISNKCKFEERSKHINEFKN
jgi:hypothetical protein